jgi:hypothetical protein
MEELLTQPAAVLDPSWPGHDQRIARAAEVAGDLLGPLEQGIHGVRPGGRAVVKVLRPAAHPARRTARTTYDGVRAGLHLPWTTLLQRSTT